MQEYIEWTDLEQHQRAQTKHTFNFGTSICVLSFLDVELGPGRARFPNDKNPRLGVNSTRIMLIWKVFGMGLGSDRGRQLNNRSQRYIFNWRAR